MFKNLERRRRRREGRRRSCVERAGGKGLSSLVLNLILIDSFQFIHVFETFPTQAVRRRRRVKDKECRPTPLPFDGVSLCISPQQAFEAADGSQESVHRAPGHAFSVLPLCRASLCFGKHSEEQEGGMPTCCWRQAIATGPEGDEDNE